MSANSKVALKIREHNSLGVYVENLTKYAVFSYEEIEAKIDEGTKNRSVSATLMNSTSSRAHTIINIIFKQKEVFFLYLSEYRWKKHGKSFSHKPHRSCRK